MMGERYKECLLHMKIFIYDSYTFQIFLFACMANTFEIMFTYSC